MGTDKERKQHAMTIRTLGRRDALRSTVFAAVGTTTGLSAGQPSPHDSQRAPSDVLPNEILRHGAYLCVRVADAARRHAAAAAVPALAERLGLRNEFEPGATGHPSDAVGFMRRIDATRRDIEDAHLLGADAVIHVASRSAASVTEFCAEAARLLAPEVTAIALRGVVRPPSYTGAAMHNFAYAHQVQQQPGAAMPNAFLIPMNKTPGWWAKNWLERHTYFLPRYDEAGRMVSEGHALAAAAGIPCLMRRTYRNLAMPAPNGEYDFLNYFECGEADLPVFDAVCAALRDVTKNPEWKFVREGPTWHGRRVATWAELFA